MFDRIEDYVAVADDPDLDVTADTVIVVRNAGPRGYPGFPEVGNVPMPRRLLTAGSPTWCGSPTPHERHRYGTCVLHVAPEASVGGPLALVRTGDPVRLDVPARRLDLLVDDAELEHRRAAWRPPQPAADRGWVRLYSEHVMQADRGADLDFLIGGSGSATPRHSH